MNDLPNIFVIGMSRVGKTPLADQLAEPINFIRISASEWIRDGFVPKDPANALAEITQASMKTSGLQTLKRGRCTRKS